MTFPAASSLRDGFFSPLPGTCWSQDTPTHVTGQASAGAGARFPAIADHDCGITTVDHFDLRDDAVSLHWVVQPFSFAADYQLTFQGSFGQLSCTLIVQTFHGADFGSRIFWHAEMFSNAVNVANVSAFDDTHAWLFWRFRHGDPGPFGTLYVERMDANDIGAGWQTFASYELVSAEELANLGAHHAIGVEPFNIVNWHVRIAASSTRATLAGPTAQLEYYNARGVPFCPTAPGPVAGPLFGQTYTYRDAKGEAATCSVYLQNGADVATFATTLRDRLSACSAAAFQGAIGPYFADTFSIPASGGALVGIEDRGVLTAIAGGTGQLVTLDIPAIKPALVLADGGLDVSAGPLVALIAYWLAVCCARQGAPLTGLVGARYARLPIRRRFGLATRTPDLTGPGL